jgi:hypothetical protein
MAINTTSFHQNAARAGCTTTSGTEESATGLPGSLPRMSASYCTYMGNDLGGKARRWSLDWMMATGNALSVDFQLLASDVTNGVSPWELIGWRARTWVRDQQRARLSSKLGGGDSNGPLRYPTRSPQESRINDRICL